MCIHIKIKSPPAILHQRGVCMGEEGEQCCHTSCLLIRELPRNAQKKKENPQTLRITIKKIKTWWFYKRVDDKLPQKRRCPTWDGAGHAAAVGAERVLQEQERRELRRCCNAAGREDWLSWRGLQPSAAGRGWRAQRKGRGGKKKKGH